MIGRHSARVPQSRRAIAALVALATLVLATSIGALVLRAALLHRRTVDQYGVRLQAEWLFEGAIERARAQIRRNPSYAGEKWEIPAAELQGTPASVRIEAQHRRSDGPTTIQISVELPAGMPVVARTKTVVIER